jgi:dTDP-glucose pyrophosphorylase
MKFLNIVVPMAGAGKQFKENGYFFPKPLVEIHGRPMIQIVVENLIPKMKHRFIFIVRKKDIEDFALREVLQRLSPSCEIIAVDGETGGSACSTFLAVDFIDNEDNLVLANADQFLNMKLDRLIADSLKRSLDANIVVFDSVHPKWSFVKTDPRGNVIEAAEKKPISRNATVGVYHFTQGKTYLEAAKQMIRKGQKALGQFFICPAFNEMVLKGKKIGIYKLDARNMHSLGTPDDVSDFEKNWSGKR